MKFKDYAETLELILYTETWLTENDPLEKYGIDGYQPLESKPNRAAMVKKMYLCMSYTI